MNRTYLTILLGLFGCMEAKYADEMIPVDAEAGASADEDAEIESVDGMTIEATWAAPNALRLAWTAVEGAQSYQLTLSGPEEYIHEAEDLAATSSTIDGLDAGEYTAEVHANDGDGYPIARARVTQLIGENRLVYRSEVPLDRAMDVWGAGDFAVIGGGTNPRISALVVDLSNPTEPVVVHTLTDIGFVRDIKVFDDLLFTAVDPESDGCALCDDVGVRIFDFGDPSAPVLLSEIGAPTSWVHNMTYSNGHLYVASIGEDEVVVFDVTEPTDPKRVGDWQAVNVPFSKALHGMGQPPHDMTAKGDKLYVAHVTGFSVVDISDPKNPTTLADMPVNMGMHNVWPNEDETLMVGTQEIFGGELTLWDISDLDNIRLLDAITTGDDRTVHNGYFDNGTVFAAWYIDGIFSFEVEDGQMKETGSFDTFEGEVPPPPDGMTMSGPPIDGAWGLWTLGDHIVVGDTVRGLLVFDHYPNTVVSD